MDVILLERIEKLGQMGDVVNVKPGYARNFLLPQKKALRANKQNMAYFEAQKAALEAEDQKRRQEAEGVAGQLDGLMLTVIRQAGASGQLYGSVSPRDVSALLEERGIPVKRDQVVIETPVKTLGIHDVRVRLHGDVTRIIRINVARSDDEAELQEQRGGMVTADILEAEEAAEEAAAAEAEAQALLESADGDADAPAEEEDAKA